MPISKRDRAEMNNRAAISKLRAVDTAVLLDRLDRLATKQADPDRTRSPMRASQIQRIKKVLAERGDLNAD